MSEFQRDRVRYPLGIVYRADQPTVGNPDEPGATEYVQGRNLSESACRTYPNDVERCIAAWSDNATDELRALGHRLIKIGDVPAQAFRLHLWQMGVLGCDAQFEPPGQPCFPLDIPKNEPLEGRLATFAKQKQQRRVNIDSPRVSGSPKIIMGSHSDSTAQTPRRARIVWHHPR